MYWTIPCGCNCAPGDCRLCSDNFVRADSTDINQTGGEFCGWTEDNDLLDDNADISSNRLRFLDDDARVISNTTRPAGVGLRVEIQGLNFPAIGGEFLLLLGYQKDPSFEVYVKVKPISSTEIEISVSGSTDDPQIKIVSSSTGADLFFVACYEFGVPVVVIDFDGERYNFALSPTDWTENQWGVGTGADGTGITINTLLAEHTGPGCGCAQPCDACDPNQTDGTPFSVPITVGLPGAGDGASPDCTEMECSDTAGAFTLIQSPGDACTYQYRGLFDCAEHPETPIQFIHQVQFINNGDGTGHVSGATTIDEQPTAQWTGPDVSIPLDCRGEHDLGGPSSVTSTDYCDFTDVNFTKNANS